MSDLCVNGRARVGIEPTNKGFADLFLNPYSSLKRNELIWILAMLQTILGPEATPPFISLAGRGQDGPWVTSS